MLERTEEAAPPISEIDLRRFERDANLALPPDYRTFLLKHNGGRPVPADFMLTLEDEPEHWRVHFFFGLNDPEESCCLRWNWEITKATRPAGTIPIASDEGGNMFYLRWDGPDEGSVHFGATPSDGRRVRLVHICASFSEFLAQLHEIKE
jgi:SMI1 / KNR4 family (SUKH-1)